MIHRQAFVAGIISSGASSPSELSSELVLGTNTANKPAPYQRSNIDINITNHYSSKIYTSSSPIVGDVTITTKRDVRFDSIEILLLGNTRTKTEGVNAPVEIAHTFLKLVMPIPSSTYPVPRVLENGKTLTIPFNFVIPNQLTIGACNHNVQTDQVRDQHVLLPPSMGKEWEIDDMAPTMASVEYSIKARVLHQPNLGGERIRIMEARKSIHVLPASPEEPPLNITENDQLYCMYKKKSLRKFLSSRIGTLTAEAIQPRAAILQSNGRTMTSTPMAQIRLKYEPISSQQHLPPPSITNISGKVTAHTFFNAGTTPTFPNLGNWTADYSTDKRGVYSTSVPLPKLSVVHPTTWQQHPCSLIERRDSGYASDRSSSSASETETRQLIPPSSPPPPPTTSSMPSSRSSFSSTKKARPSSSSSSSSTSSIYLTSTLSIPLSLPLDRRTFIPTFHSCIVSRVYTLTLSVTAAVVGSTCASTTFSLTLPLQVAVEWDPEQQEQQRVDGQGLPHFESLYGTTTGANGTNGTTDMEGVNEEEEMAAAEEHLRPRVIGLPPDSWYREMQMQRESHREREIGREVVRGADNGGGQQQQQVRVAEEGRLPGYGEAILTR
ncbi:hypothetical protein GE21DRAFT_5871 [Neurospora crassa]|uniref:Arrestin-like N-terminal domain-containing protein n=1 Tax=Neurospora crassa (strain ATCC 24698 / 74-OR23-1A / CBS 708.71 / DSM 1257 / FGSC 987) TaxID=367110 RepID=Q7S9T0_NEUCR|nr:hypothetical protein NCU06376 [Neurospora crassa OR74A]EAA33174.2 hypothetical protein NCU06376 [Neurospora crassa OR74A]KHE85563.1 hypothetical protein GE21DRAFT_5871 [Neurospora crassa]|eukprot:XP_962410.2 hypothetical protein NCU06376 [Neurospora crassa OR74A]